MGIGVEGLSVAGRGAGVGAGAYSNNNGIPYSYGDEDFGEESVDTVAQY